MGMMRTLRVACLTSTLTGCYVFFPPPSVDRPKAVTIGESQLLSVDTGSVTEERTKYDKHEACDEHGMDCQKYTTKRSVDVSVNTAAATVDGEPMSIGDVAVATSEKYRKDTDRYLEIRPSCRNGRIVMTMGLLAMTASFYLLNVGYGSEMRRDGFAYGGIGALAGGATALAAGRFVLGGQTCGEAEQIYRSWSPVYRDPNAMEVRGQSADYLEQLVEKFNQARDTAEESAANDADASNPMDLEPREPGEPTE